MLIVFFFHHIIHYRFLQCNSTHSYHSTTATTPIVTPSFMITRTSVPHIASFISYILYCFLLFSNCLPTVLHLHQPLHFHFFSYSSSASSFPVSYSTYFNLLYTLPHHWYWVVSCPHTFDLVCICSSTRLFLDPSLLPLYDPNVPLSPAKKIQYIETRLKCKFLTPPPLLNRTQINFSSTSELSQWQLNSC